mmetsp:Transcript_140455/g.261852  ORF Transcript_140455/g.261852 Transcript_140455/m.261852 type:complete len:554 (-) Transcript_140455:57-1718(-)
MVQTLLGAQTSSDAAGAPVLAAASTEVTEMFLVVSSFCFLVPAIYASWAGHWFHAVMFVVMTIVCTVYHVCDAKSYLGEPECKVLPQLTYADHVCAYYCFMQMSFLLLGVEDPRMHAAVREADSNRDVLQPALQKGVARQSLPPMDVILFSRIIPAFGILWFLQSFTSWGNFHFNMIIIWICLVILVSGVFWLQRERRSFAQTVFLRAGFWMRFVSIGMIPSLCCTALFVSVQRAAHGRVIHSVWHIVDAVLATNLQRTVFTQRRDPVYRLLNRLFRVGGSPVDILSVAPSNPPVAHWLLALASFTQLLMMMMGACLQSCFSYRITATRAAKGAVRLAYWPVLGIDILKRPAGFLMEACWVLVLLAITATFAMVEVAVQRSHSSDKELILGKIGSTLNYTGIAFGALSALTVIARSTLLRVLTVSAGCCTATAGIVLTTCSVHSQSRSAVVGRMLIAFGLCIASVIFLVLLSAVYQAGGMDYDGQLVHTACPMLLTACAGCEYAIFVLIAVWPLTFMREVREHWEVSKIALPTKQRIDALITHTWQRKPLNNF